jgi:hypothetical protein
MVNMTIAHHVMQVAEQLDHHFTVAAATVKVLKVTHVAITQVEHQLVVVVV